MFFEIILCIIVVIDYKKTGAAQGAADQIITGIVPL